MKLDIEESKVRVIVKSLNDRDGKQSRSFTVYDSNLEETFGIVHDAIEKNAEDDDTEQQ